MSLPSAWTSLVMASQSTSRSANSLPSLVAWVFDLGCDVGIDRALTRPSDASWRVVNSSTRRVFSDDQPLKDLRESAVEEDKCRSKQANTTKRWRSRRLVPANGCRPSGRGAFDPKHRPTRLQERWAARCQTNPCELKL